MYLNTSEHRLFAKAVQKVGRKPVFLYTSELCSNARAVQRVRGRAIVYRDIGQGFSVGTWTPGWMVIMSRLWLIGGCV